jgi:Glycosyltransferases, probably involved in cell wall biogenesis
LNFLRKKKNGLSGYLLKQKGIPLSEHIPCATGLQLQVVIPCYNEPGLTDTLNSLLGCSRNGFGTEVIVLINSYENTSSDILCQNEHSFRKAGQMAALYNRGNFKIVPLSVSFPGNKTGAGLPRKTGMDEALRRLVRAGKEDGIIVSLDADCTVKENYLEEIYHYFNDLSVCSATIRFRHPVEQLHENDPLKKAMSVYETYLHYYKKALEFTGYPYAYYTVGSAFAVRASVYANAGGMGKQQAGEDFYFLQKVFPMGKTAEITATEVYPAARLSDRVPFGTGPALTDMLVKNNFTKYTYSLDAFRLLKAVFDQIDSFYDKSETEIGQLLDKLPEPIQSFLYADLFVKQLMIVKDNTSSLPAFRKRFFHYFNAFKILKYLNYVHPHYFELKEVREEYENLLQEVERPC